MRERLHHMLFDRAHRNAELGGDLTVLTTLELVQNKDGSSPLRKCQKRRCREPQIFLPAQNSMWVKIFASVSFRVEGQMLVRPAGGAPASAVCEHARGCLEDVTGEIFNWRFAVTRHNAREHFLHEIINLGRIPDARAKIPAKRLAQRRGFGREAMTIVARTCRPHHQARFWRREWMAWRRGNLLRHERSDASETEILIDAPKKFAPGRLDSSCPEIPARFLLKR